MGRGPDGKAKIINVDENGNVKVQLSGTIESHQRLTSGQRITIEPGEEAEIFEGIPLSQSLYARVSFYAYPSAGSPNVSLHIKATTTPGNYHDSVLSTYQEYIPIHPGNVALGGPPGHIFSIADTPVMGREMKVIVKNHSIRSVSIRARELVLTDAPSSNKCGGFPFSFKKTFADTTGERLHENWSCSEVLITADVDNDSAILVYPSDGLLNDSRPLKPGEWIAWPIRNLRYLSARAEKPGDILYIQGVL